MGFGRSSRFQTFFGPFRIVSGPFGAGASRGAKRQKRKDAKVKNLQMKKEADGINKSLGSSESFTINLIIFKETFKGKHMNHHVCNRSYAWFQDVSAASV